MQASTSMEGQPELPPVYVFNGFLTSRQELGLMLVVALTLPGITLATLEPSSMLKACSGGYKRINSLI